MSKIKAVDFAKYVDVNKNNAKNILKQKGVHVQDNKSLSYYVNNIQNLPDKPEEEEYQHDSYFAKFIEDFDNDPLRAENGGEYKYCGYFIIAAWYDTSLIYSRLVEGASTKQPFLIKTSDGQEFSITSSSSFTITWDKSKDIDSLDDGTIIRWIKVYTNYSVGGRYCCGFYESNSVVKTAPLLYMIWDLSDTISLSNSSSRNVGQINYCPIRAIVFGINAKEHGYQIGYYLNSLRYLEIRASDLYCTDDNSFIGTCRNLKKFKFNKLHFSSSQQIFSECNSLKELDLSNCTFNSGGGVFISGASSLEVLIFPEKISIAALNGTTSLKNLTIYNNEYEATNINNGYALESLTVGEEWNSSLNLISCYNISKHSILNIFNNLKDLTQEATKTISLSRDWTYNLTDEELAIAQNKNWTVSFS